MNRSELREGFELLLDAIEAETSAMTDKAMSNTEREIAQVKVLDHMHRLQRDTGLVDMLQRRLVVEIRGCANGTPVRASDLPSDPASYKGEAAGRKLQCIVKQTAFDCGYLPKHVAGLLGGEALFTKNGFKLTGALGDLSEPVPVPGRNANDGPAFSNRLLLVQSIGYTAGYEEMPRTRRFTSDMFKRAYRLLHSRGVPKSYRPMAETVRDWCKGAEKEMFENAYLSGCAALAAGAAPDPDLLLPKLKP
jgi:hypothetical protein